MGKDRDRKVRDEAQHFCNVKANNPQPCIHHKPTLDELQSTTFTEYVRRVVLRQAEPRYEETSHETDKLHDTRDDRPPPAKEMVGAPPTPYTLGMAKVTLPKGFRNQELDDSGRGPMWQKGTELGDKTLPSPIKQCVRGIGGVYEFTFVDQPAVSVAEYREKADDYIRGQLGNNHDDYDVEYLERKFWKRLGPTMQPALYGADMEGTLFEKKDYCNGWNISKLDSCLELLLSDQPEGEYSGIPGVTTPYLYVGMWATVFCAHTEDMNLMAINYLHAGAPKVWYSVAAGEDSLRLEHLCEGLYHQAKTGCPEYMRHKRCLISPARLKKAGIRFSTTVQYPGDAMIAFPGSYHFGFNTGFNVAEATNFAVPEWVPYGKRAKVCLCRPDSVRIDMAKFERLLLQYEREVKQSKRLTWRDWAAKLKKRKKEQENRHLRSVGGTKREKSTNQRPKQKEFWVEVLHPKANSSSKRKRKSPEVWHLAKPSNRKALCPSARVLCILPALVETSPGSSPSSDDEEEDELCFAGTITEVRDDHVRVHFEGLARKEDMWLSIASPKMFLDGGRWGEDTSEELPALHYWREEDSKRHCS